jgi:hypothetical protein
MGRAQEQAWVVRLGGMPSAVSNGTRRRVNRGNRTDGGFADPSGGMIAGPPPADKATGPRCWRNLVREPTRPYSDALRADRQAILSDTRRLFSVTPPMLWAISLVAVTCSPTAREIASVLAAIRSTAPSTACTSSVT